MTAPGVRRFPGIQWPAPTPPEVQAKVEPLAYPDRQGKPTVADVFADRARLKKVAAMIRCVPEARDQTMAAEIILAMEKAPQFQRNDLARQANINKPSERTWQLLIDAVRKRDEKWAVPF